MNVQTTNVERMTEVYDDMLRAWQQHDVDGLLACLTEDVRWSEPDLGTVTGKEAVRAWLEALFAGFPNIAWPDEHIAWALDGEAGVTFGEWTAESDMTGKFKGAPATGRHQKVSGVNVARFRGDLVCDYRIYYDRLGSYTQLGLLPSWDGPIMKGLAMTTMLAGKAKHAVLRN